MHGLESLVTQNTRGYEGWPRLSTRCAMTQRTFQNVRVGEQAFQFDVMIYGGTRNDRQPLLILHSIEFATPPSTDVCEYLWQSGFQVIFVHRAGFGRSSPLPRALNSEQSIKSGVTACAEAAMLRQLIVRLGLRDLNLLAIGSANPVAYRLVQMAREISYSVFVNPIFNQDIWQVFSPMWFRTMLK